jgi:hypothetical protein
MVSWRGETSAPKLLVGVMRLKSEDSERKWKEKLKEWKFEKNIPANDMSFIVAKAEKRAREEGKETIFFHRETQVTRERIEQFKRRKITKGRDVLSLDSPGAGRHSI